MATTRLSRTLGLAIVPLLLAACANASSTVAGDGDATAGGSPGVSVPGAAGSASLGHEPIDRVIKPCGTESEGPGGTVSITPCSGGPVPSPVSSPVTPTPGMAGVHARGWDSADVSADGRAVTISFVSGVEPCSVLDHVDVAYGADAVTITLFEGHDPSAGQVACPDIGVFKQVTVDLEEPVGDRAVRDGAA